ncbi:MAG: Hpt domain-containing protein [Bacteroidetes bacterium]|jgi:HPt (histidine-containing phosphotransfer) domain-containing protein|nr:Hpt domain-containing protein [Bacteroidota bacterium]
MEYKYINTEYLDSVSGDDDTVISELIDIFREQVIEIKNEMQQLLSEKDYYSLGLLAHKAKSSVAIMGMDELASILKTFELEAKEGLNPEKYGNYINKFGNDTAGAVKELDHLLICRLNKT